MVRSHNSLKARSRKSLWMMSGVFTSCSLALFSLYKARTVSWMHKVLRSRSVMEFIAARFSGDSCTTFNALDRWRVGFVTRTRGHHLAARRRIRCRGDRHEGREMGRAAAGTGRPQPEDKRPDQRRRYQG